MDCKLLGGRWDGARLPFDFERGSRAFRLTVALDDKHPTSAPVRRAVEKEDLGDLIRERAYTIWLQEGCPRGRSVTHWEMAKAEILRQHLWLD